MARKRIGMQNIREIIRYHVTTDLSERQIARALQVSRAVVGKYLRAFAGSGLGWQEVAQMADSALIAQLEGLKKEPKSTRYRQLSEKFPGLLAELKKKGVTLQLLWEEYLQEHPDGYQYTQFCYHFQAWRNNEVRMHIEHKAGDKMFADYAGTKLAVTDRVSGEQRDVEVYIGILGASELTYVEASESQEEKEWVRSNERALRYFQGSTAALVPDNLKSAVTRADRYEPGINHTFEEFARYYGMVVVPARVRKARDKALAENGVRLVYQRIYAPLRNQTFYSLKELNEAIWRLLEKHNNTNFQGMDISRRELFEQIERDVLRPLPAEPFPMISVQVVNVQYNYHVKLLEDQHNAEFPIMPSNPPVRQVHRSILLRDR